uniref:Uncharacterized protein n=1 Tax=Arundo donax TaxID=35708 RepID=A0A0A8Y4Y0_ARUDO
MNPRYYLQANKYSCL